ncbi:hypothetical protein CGJ24_15640 [Vibrio parahaemolyticus]|uniref:hypothetical protein n=1 Tax=Vibrio parahaemolyticus TaxID=670 RepID=UPI00111CF6D1|nr:hypothetical protein [Vibrio parahaemolyticus]TOF36170.1 hypothetical protein CGJ24_15640 [Vibrio parahaemolyticus]
MVTPIDESVQSFIFRQTLLRKGALASKGIFSKCGGWYCEPRITEDVRESFERLSDQKLIQLVEASISERIRHYGLFAPPSVGQSVVERVIGSKSISFKQRIIRIRYCPQCIDEMICDVGFGYFRKSWNGSDWCLKHQASLEILDSANAKTSAKLVSQLLAGLSVPSVKPLSHSSKQKKSSEWGAKRLTVYPIKASLCTIGWFSDVLSDIDLGSSKNGWNGSIVSKANYRDSNFGPFDGRWYYSSSSYGFGIDTHMIWLQHHPRVSKLFNEEVDYFVYNFGPKKQLAEYFFAPKSRKCTFCKKLECREMVTQSEKVDRPEFIDLFKTSSMIKRFVENKFTLYRTSNHPWGPLVVEIGRANEALVVGEFGGLI